MKNRVYGRLASGLLVLALTLASVSVPTVSASLAAASAGDVVINEIMQNPSAVADSSGEWFELYNATGTAVDIDGWTIKDDDIDSHVIDNGGPLEIPAGGFLVLGNNGDAGTNGGVTVDYVYGSDWFLANGADEVVLLEGSAEIDRVEYDGGPAFPNPNGAAMALKDPTLDNNDGANWCVASTPYGDGDLGTPGAENDCEGPPPSVPEVVINEIMQNPSAVSDSNGEWFELYNTSGSAIDIDGWTIRDDGSDSHVINNGGPLEIPADGFLVLGNNGDTLTNGGVTVDYVYGSSWYLANSDDEVVLLDDSLTEVDRVDYDDGATFPDPNGAAMALEDPALDNNDGANWCVASTPYGDGDLGTPGAENDCGAGPPPSPSVSIYDIQYTEDDSGDSPYEGQTVTTQGIVTAFFYAGGDRYTFIQDGTGPWSGILLYQPDGFVDVGDLLQVTGEVSEYKGLTEFYRPAVTVLSSENDLPAPEVLPTSDVSTEQWESVLVRVEDVTVTDEDLGYGEWQVDDGSDPVVIDDLGDFAYSPANGDTLDFVQGPLFYSFGAFKIEPRDDADILASRFIWEIQGDGLASPLVETQVSIEGIVVGDFQNIGSGDSGDLGGFFVQEEDDDADGNLLTSDGVFVYDGWFGVDVEMGDCVRVNGFVSEYYDLTEIGSVSDVLFCDGEDSATPAAVTLPVDTIDDLEAYEGMSVVFGQELFISEFFNFDRYGEIVLTTERQFQPTAIHEPGSPEAAALAEANLLSRIQLEDGRTSENPDPALHPNGGIFDLTNRFRGGDTVQNVTGVMSYGYGQYEIHPTAGADYTAVNQRPDVPDVGGSIKAASFNVLNYFTTIDTGDWVCGPTGGQECRGADSENEFERQQTKIVEAMCAIEADIFGLMELENQNPDNDPDPDDGIANYVLKNLVDALNDEDSPCTDKTYAFTDSPAAGPDAIRQGIIYKSDTVTPLGRAVLDDAGFIDPNNLGDPKNRPAIAETFIDNETGGIFTAVVNHFKSKGSPCGPGDDDPEQGNCNLTRTLAAQVLADWLATDPTGSGDADVLILGDLNSYDKEDPIDVLKANGYTDLLLQYEGEEAYTYVFDGQLGYLDYGMPNGDLLPEVTGVTAWHINADEPDILDYDTTFKKPAQDALFDENPYRSSDHDPVIVGLDVCDEIPPMLEVTVSPDMLWPPNHKYVTVDPTITVSDNFDPNPTVTLVSMTSNEPDNGLGDGDMPNDIVINEDGTFDLRAERSGTGDGRIYTLTYMATDACGNTTEAMATVTVPFDQRGKGKGR